MTERSKALDGLRGTAAMAVVAYHFCAAYLPSMLSEQTPNPWRGSDLPISILYNGGFAVSVFFVISGFVISNSAAKRTQPFLISAMQRYARLAIPVLAGTLFGWLLLTIFPGTVSDLKANDNHIWLTWVYDGVRPGFLSAARDGLYDVFRTGGSRFNNVLWTMHIELVGSLLLYAIYSFSAEHRRMLVLWIATLVLLPRPEYMAFCCGALLREKLLRREVVMPVWQSWLLFALSVFFGAMMQGYGTRLGLPPLPPLIALGEPHKVIAVLAAVGLVLTAKVNPTLHAMFSTRLLVWLGAISFGLYLVHVPLLYTAFVPLFLAVQHSAASLWCLFVMFGLTSILLGAVFTWTVDRPTLAMLPLIRSVPEAIRVRLRGPRRSVSLEV